MTRTLHFGFGGIARSLTLSSALVGGLALAATPAFAQSESAGTPGEWLTRYTSARTLGMGGAFVAQADDPLGVLWNPAGLSGMEQNEVRFEHARLFEETSMNSIGFAVPGSRLPSLGVMVLSMRSGEFQRTNDMNDDLGTFRDSETAYLLTASRALNNPAQVSAEVLRKVSEAVQQTGYVPNLLAGGLASTRSRLVAAVVPTISGPVFLQTVQALTEALATHGYQLMLGQSGYVDSREDALLEAIIGRRPDGIVLTGILHSPEGRRRLQACGIPVVETAGVAEVAAAVGVIVGAEGTSRLSFWSRRCSSTSTPTSRTTR